MPFDSTCGGCWHHGDSSGGSGECRALPPTELAYLPVIGPPAQGAVEVKTYIRTADTEPACGLFRPLVEPEAPPVESRVERIERLKRDGCTDLAAFKRALDGR